MRIFGHLHPTPANIPFPSKNETLAFNDLFLLIFMLVFIFARRSS